MPLCSTQRLLSHRRQATLNEDQWNIVRHLLPPHLILKEDYVLVADPALLLDALEISGHLPDTKPHLIIEKYHVLVADPALLLDVLEVELLAALVDLVVS